MLNDLRTIHPIYYEIRPSLSILLYTSAEPRRPGSRRLGSTTFAPPRSVSSPWAPCWAAWCRC